MYVVVSVAGILAAQLVVWSAVLVWFRWRRRVIASRLAFEIASETIIHSPEPGTYRGATVAGYPTVNNDGMIALTGRRLVFHTLTGKVIEIPVSDIVGVREAEVFKSAVKAGRQHLIIQTSSGDIGFFVSSNDAWIASLTARGARPVAVGGSTDSAFAELEWNVKRGARKRRAAKKILAVVFTSIGLASGLAAGIGAAVIGASISGDRHIDGTVVDLSHEGKGYRPVVQFVPPDSAPVRFTSSLGSSPPAFRVGEHVEVRYNPDNPQDASIDQYWQLWFLPTLFGIFSVSFLVVGIGFGVATLAAANSSAAQANSSQ
jgi:hypothetical protein